jgi:4-diphosphocytidyl-2-C-methyl-D-erythritol kinase
MADSGNHIAQQELARAKLNLTLEIKGKRPDGYHELESLVLFADFGDGLTYEQSDTALQLTVDGPFATACSGFTGHNLVTAAAQAFAAFHGTEPRGVFRLTKNLPVAAGIGGGSADAAAAFRLLAACHAPKTDDIAALIPAARQIGADVPVCLYSRAMLMTGVGEKLHPLAPPPSIPAVLVNPMQPLATRDVFRELAAAPLAAPPPKPPRIPTLADFDALVAYARASRNDLEPPARRLLPVIAEILDALAAAPGAVLARLSGSGPTCFALFADRADAENAATNLQRAHPGWWVRATSLS